MSYMKCGNCESWERCVECGWCVFCAESEKAKLLSEIERLRRVDAQNTRLKNALLLLLDGRSIIPADVEKELKAALEGNGPD